MFPQAEVARIDIRPYPETIGVLPGLYVRGDAMQAVTALNAMLEARQVRRRGFPHRRNGIRAARAGAPLPARRPTGWIRAYWRGSCPTRCRRARC